MTRLTWGDSGNRFYETGVDRGVLYTNGVGVPWNGLTAVKESPSGAEPTPYYIDGVKYRNLTAAEEFAATIEALSSPPEFDACDGVAQIHNGLFVSEQPREPFDLCYRTLVGNDLDGEDHGYKIHLVYNALAAPTERANSTRTDSPSPMGLSWTISTMPPPLVNRRPSAHFVIDSRTTDPGLLIDLEDILYGSDDLVSSIPTPTELVALFVAPELTVNWVGAVDASASELRNGRTGVLLRTNMAFDPRTPSSGSGGTGSTSSFATGSDSRFKTGLYGERSWTVGPTVDAGTNLSSISQIFGVISNTTIHMIQARVALTGSLQTGTIVVRSTGTAVFPTTLFSGSVNHGDGTITYWRCVRWDTLPSTQPSIGIVARPANGAAIRSSDYLMEELDAPINGPLPFFCGSVLPS